MANAPYAAVDDSEPPTTGGCMAPDRPTAPAATGLEGVSIGQTAIALVDGDAGRLIYRGHDAEVLARESCFEAVAWLLWTGELPSDEQLRSLRGELVEGMTTPEPMSESVETITRAVNVEAFMPCSAARVK